MFVMQQSRNASPPKRANAAASRAVRGLRITVHDVLGWLAAGMSEQDILTDYPELELADSACLALAAEPEQRGMPVAA